MEKQENTERPTATANQPLVAICLAASVGVCGDRWIGIGPPALVWTLAALCWLAWLYVVRTTRTSPRRIQFAGWMLLASIALAMSARHHTYWRRFPVDHVGLRLVAAGVAADPELAAVRGRLTSLPEFVPLPEAEPLSTIPLGVRTLCDVRVMEIRDGERWVAASGKLSVRVNGHLLNVHTGDEVQIYGTLSLPPRPLNPGQSDVGLEDRDQRVLCRLDVPYPECVTLRKRAGSSVMASVGRLRAAGLRLLDEYLAPTRGELAGALLLGARDRLDSERTELFFHTGTIHLLAISGLHVGILAWAFLVLAQQSVARSWILLTLMCLTVVYCLLTGMRAPVLRAAILIQVVCVGLILRRKILAWNALAAAAIFVLMLRPTSLFRTGAQLSFLAVATLIWLTLHPPAIVVDELAELVQRTRPWYQRLVYGIWERGRQLAAASLAIWLVTLPLVMYQFHLLSPISLALNIVLAIPVAVGLLSGFGVLMFGAFVRPLATIAGLICDVSLACFETTVRWAHDVPGAWFWVGGPTLTWCVLYYIVLALIACAPKLVPTRRWLAALFCAWLAIPAAFGIVADWTKNVTAANERELRCTFLSVGHGTCVVLETPDDRVLLYDCGRMGFPETGVRLVSEYLWHRRISHVDSVIVSHADADHYNVLPGLLTRFSVGQIFATPFMFNAESPGVVALRKAIEKADVPVKHLQADDQLCSGGATLCVLHPLTKGVRGSDNANSILIEIEYQQRRILLPGDLETPGIEDVMAELPRDVDILMAPHHGSSRSSPADFLKWCTPEYVVVSGGRGKFPSETRDVFATGGRHVLHTAEVGAVTCTIMNGELDVRAFLSP